jgi:hypothetical protein
MQGSGKSSKHFAHRPEKGKSGEEVRVEEQMLHAPISEHTCRALTIKQIETQGSKPCSVDSLPKTTIDSEELDDR